MRSCIGFLLAFLLTHLNAAAQTGIKPLTLEDCIRLAMDAQSEVSIAKRQSEIAKYAVVESKAGFLPRLQVLNGWTYNSPSLDNRTTFSFTALNGIREYTAFASASVELDTSGKLRAALTRARADQDAASANLALSQRDLKRAVTLVYYQLLLSRRLVGVGEDALGEAQNFEKRTQLLFEHGEVAQGDVIKASAQSAFLEQAVIEARLQAEIANHSLASFWTSAVRDLLPIEDRLDQTIPSPDPVAAASAPPFLRRQEFKLFDAEHRGFQADAHRARADLLPQANLVFNYGIDALQVRARDRGYAAFVNVNIPVFDWLKARSQAHQFELKVQQVETTRAIAERTFSREYETALARVREVYRQISIAEKQVRLSEQNLNISKIRYEGGEGSALDVVSAQSQLAQARTNYFTALAAYRNARADLEVAEGR